MNSAEAKAILTSGLNRYRHMPYVELQRLLEQQDQREIVAPSGTKYQIEIQAFWDTHRGGNLRVRGAIDDGGLRALLPIVEDFIVTPSGEFVGE